jgi:hypothetical protein
MEINRCVELTKLLEFEREKLRKAIDLHKYYLSEKAPGDVGFQFAEQDFMKKYLQKWAIDSRNNYCESICEHSHECTIYQESLIKLPV